MGTDAGGSITTGTYNTLFGSLAGRDLTTADRSTLIGRGAGRGITNSQGNTCIGNDTGAAIVTGSGNNTFVGDGSGVAVSTGAYNSCNGAESLATNTVGSYNYAGGYQAGKFRTAGPGGTSISPTDSIYVGAESKSGAPSGSVINEIVIGKGAVGNGTNTATIGNASCSTCHINGSVYPTGDIYMADGKNIAADTTNGTKIGTSASQKLAFWGDTPVVQPATGNITPATYQHVASSQLHVDSTFGGYTIAQVVGALQQIGILA
jgi:hypothetical protein